MSEPTREQLDEVFAALVSNGFDFFGRLTIGNSFSMRWTRRRR